MSNLPRGEQQPSDRFFGSYGLLKSSDLNRSVSPGLQDWFRAFGLDEEVMGVVQQTDFDLRRKLRGSNLKVNMSLIPRPKQPPHRLSHARTRRYVSEPSTPPGRKARIGSGGLERREKPTFDPQFMSPFWATPVPSRRTNMPHRQTRPAPKRTGALSRPKPVVQQSPLLRLSGELRNEIYRYVLLERDPIMVTSTGYSTNGGLLASCKQIRSEALDIFYKENEFEHVIRNFNSKPMVQWCIKNRAPLVCAYIYQPCWKNLLVWFENIHARKCGSYSVFGDPKAMLKADSDIVRWYSLAEMCKITKRMRGQPWELVKEIVELLRPQLIVHDDRWRGDCYSCGPGMHK